jgi:hypothetical protein
VILASRDRSAEPSQSKGTLFHRWGLDRTWTPIAWRPRHGDGSNLLTWTMFLDAPIDVETAHKLQAAGRLLMANRHTGERVELVVRWVPPA